MTYKPAEVTETLTHMVRFVVKLGIFAHAADNKPCCPSIEKTHLPLMFDEERKVPVN